LFTINPNNANSITSVTITLSGEVVNGANGLATHPITGELYAILKIDPSNDRVLVKINPDTGVATNIGPFSLSFASLAFNDAGVLFGITGWGDRTDSKALYTVDITNGVATRICGIGTGNFGEVIAFRPVDGMFYHASGETNVFFDKFDSDALNCNTTVINQDLTGLPQIFGEAAALTWWPSQNVFLRAGGEPTIDEFNGPYFLWKVPPDGSKPTLIGQLDHKSKGLVLAVNGQTETLYSISPFNSKFRTINTATAATIDGNPVINLNSVAVTGNALAQDSSGTFYAIVKPLLGAPGRTLVTLTETIPCCLWTANAIAQANQRFAGLAFDADDNLFGLSGEGPASDSLESIYQIDAINGAETRKCGMVLGDDGEALGYNPNDGMMYRESGIQVHSFEKFDPTTHDCSTITPINLSNSGIGEARSLAYWDSADAFLWSQRVTDENDILHKVLPDGTVTLIGTLDHRSKGLAFELIVDDCSPPASGVWTVSSTCTMTGDATADGNVIVPDGVVLTIPNGITLTVPSGAKITILSGGGILIEFGGTIIVVF